MNSPLISGIVQNNHRTISKAISLVENGDRINKHFFHELYPYTKDAIRIGITGPPGAGKSTFTNQLIKIIRDNKKTVAVIAVDPTSPFTGGALLGDRVRMNHYLWDEHVYIRSLGSQGDLGGLAKKAREIGDILAASRKDYIIFETVGVGQGEHDVMNAVDITIVILVPESGDEIQLMKAGLIEIADIFVINKSDRDGADRLAKALEHVLHTSWESKDEIPVYKTIATTGEGMDDVNNGIGNLLEKMKNSGKIDEKKIARHRQHVQDLVKDELLNTFWTTDKVDKLLKDTATIHSITLSPFEIAEELLKNA